MENQYVYVEKPSSKYEPHVLEDIVDPMRNHKSDLWRALAYTTCVLEVVYFVLFFVTLNRSILFKLWIFNPLSVLLVIAFIATPVIWFAVAGTQKRLDENCDRVKSKRRVKKKIDRFSKWDDETPEKSIRDITGMKSYNPVTGVSEHEVNTNKWSLSEHPYLGNRAIDFIVYVKTTDDEEIIIENLFEVGKTLKDGGIHVRTSMYTGETFVNNLADIERELAKKELSDVRRQALYSIYNHYSGREGNYEPLYCIHIGIPFTMNEEKAMEYVRKIRDEYETPLNVRGIETTLIMNSDIMKTIMDGIFTGKMYFTGDINEY